MLQRFLISLTPIVAIAAVSGPVAAQVLQTGDNTPLPQPVSSAELKLSMDLGWKRDTMVWKNADGTQRAAPVTYGDLFPDFVNGDAITLEGLFKWRKEAIDPKKDARVAPGYFSPTCGFSGELVLRGGNCRLALGWYNVSDPNATTPPAPGEIYELIPSNIETYMKCYDQNGMVQKEGSGFCPLAWDRHHPYNFGQVAWEPKAFDSGMIASDQRYLGKYVAFALIGDPSAQCKQTKYSLAGQNTKNAAGQPWITTLIWQSTIDPEGFYIGFEDLAMTSASWKDPGPGQNAQNDGDFNDFVYYISGVSCAGGGQSCNTGLQGACSLGRTDCALEGEPTVCHPIIQPGKELCDNVDNDCNGAVDDGSGLCPEGQVCDRGSCVGACNTGEFRCEGELDCQNGFCVEPACVGVNCAQGQACRKGTCVSACDGVTCPSGQECQLGRCVDPCAGVSCAGGKICERGLCVSNCKCRGCPDGLACAEDGRCQDTQCADISCPAGQTCNAGVCSDPCAGVVCPGGGMCISGHCTDPVGAFGSGGQGTAGGIGITLQGGSGAVPGHGAAPGAGSPGSSPGGGRVNGDPSSGCGCHLSATSSGRWASLASAALAISLMRRRSGILGRLRRRR